MDYVFSKGEIQEFNHIIDEIYVSDDYELTFYNFLNNLTELVFFEKGDIYIYKKDDENIIYDCYISVGYENELSVYKNHFCSMDDALPLISVTHPVMFRSSDIFLESERAKTDYYRNYLDPAKMHHSIEGNIYVEENGFIVGIGLHRSNEYEDFSQKELDILKLLRPHLSRVAERLCKAKVQNLADRFIDYDLTGFNEMGIWMWDGDGELIKTSFDESHLSSSYREELSKIVFSLCNSLRNNLENSESGSDHMYSKLIFENKTYFVSLSYRTGRTPKDSVYVAVLYDYINIIQNLVKSMRTQYDFTDREYEVLLCMINGKSNQEICDALFISMPTVKKHMTNVYKKLGIEGRHQLINRILTATE